MMEEEGPLEDVRGGPLEPVQHRRVERLLIVRQQDGADGGEAAGELEDLPGVVGVSLNSVTGSFDVLFDSEVVSDDELAAALHHQGFDLISWQEAQVMHAAQQRRGCSSRFCRSLNVRSSNSRNVEPTRVDSRRAPSTPISEPPGRSAS